MQKIRKPLKIAFCCIFFLFFAFCLLVTFSTPFGSIKNIMNVVYGDANAIEQINVEKPFGKFVVAKYDDSLTVSSGCSKKIKVELKLLNLFNLKTFYVTDDSEELLIGGDVVGFSLNGDGVVVISVSNVATAKGNIETTKYDSIQKGDIIKQIDGQKIKSVSDICRVVNSEENVGKELIVLVDRKGTEVIAKIKPALDKNSGLYKLGLWVKDDISGIGTLTFIKKSDDRFGALGHAISDNDTKTIFRMNNGEMYQCMVIGLKKGSKGKAGELKGLFLQGQNNKIGSVDKNCEFGVFGKVEKSELKTNRETFKAGGRLFAKPGKACIRTSLDGKTTKEYEIEIVKTNYQSKSNEKSMLLRVVDKELLQKTGGIIQGMSGSPIIQNGRIIGAVTHVFLNDSTKGFGVYLDWMLNE